MFLATRRISLETGCRFGFARRLRNSFFLVILTGPPTSRYTYKRILGAHVRQGVAWPHILRGNQGGSGRRTAMGTNTVLSCSQLITFLQGSSSFSLRSAASSSRRRDLAFRYPPTLSRSLPEDDISDPRNCSISRVFICDRATGQ